MSSASRLVSDRFHLAPMTAPSNIGANVPRLRAIRPPSRCAISRRPTIPSATGMRVGAHGSMPRRPAHATTYDTPRHLVNRMQLGHEFDLDQCDRHRLGEDLDGYRDQCRGGRPFRGRHRPTGHTDRRGLAHRDFDEAIGQLLTKPAVEMLPQLREIPNRQMWCQLKDEIGHRPPTSEHSRTQPAGSISEQSGEPQQCLGAIGTGISRFDPFERRNQFRVGN
jgi:hypothetical protein